MAVEELQSICEIIRLQLKKHLKKYDYNAIYTPFFNTNLLGKDKLITKAFLHFISSNFGTKIFEPVAVSLASSRFKVAKLQMKSGTQISEQAQYEIQKIMDDLTAANKKPDKLKEIEIIRNVCRKGKMRTVKPTRVDVYLESYDNEVYLIDIKTAKPNKGGFKEFKRTLLEWTATFLAEKPEAKINTLIAIPYNPYEPKPYSRWTMAGMLDLEKELKVAEEFWDFLGGNGTYNDLLDCFERVGIEMRDEIDKYFEKFK